MLPTMRDLALDAPEIEAKFLIPDEATTEALKALVGKKIVLKTAEGREVKYRVEMNQRHLYEDTNFDSRDLVLFRGRNMLRQRIRHDKHKGEYEFDKAVFQAKNGPVKSDALDDAVFSRNEIRGREYKRIKLFQRKAPLILRGEIADAAIAYAQQLLGRPEKLRPVLRIKDKRFFMKLEPTDPREDAPEFYVSIDKVRYRGLIGRKGKAHRLELEAEIIDNIARDPPRLQRAKLSVMNALSKYLEETFQLRRSPESKFESGIKLTVL